MELKFIAMDKTGEEEEWLRQFWRIYLYDQSQCPPYAFTVTTKQLLSCKILYITVNLDTSIKDIISLGNHSQMVLS